LPAEIALQSFGAQPLLSPLLRQTQMQLRLRLLQRKMTTTTASPTERKME
jgi:hypothetical protein